MSETEGEIQDSSYGMNKSWNNKHNLGNIVNDIVIAVYSNRW